MSKPPILIIWADGVGTAKLNPDDVRSVLLKVVQPLAQSLLDHSLYCYSIKVNWKSSVAMVGGSTSWENAAYGGVLDIDTIFENTPASTRIILLGYSGGCKVIHDWLDSRPQELHRVAAVGLLSDPFRPRERFQSGTPDPGGWGVCGENRGPIAGRTFWTSFRDDMISSCTPDNPFRTVADLSDKIPGSFVEDVGEHIHLGNWQLAAYIKLWKRDPLAYLQNLPRRMDDARKGAENYLLKGAHTRAYTDIFHTKTNGVDDYRPLTNRLAETISYRVRKDLKE